MRVNILTETELVGLETTGIVTAYRQLIEPLREQGVDVVVNAEEYDILHVHSFGPLALYRAMREDCPVVITAHSVPEEFRYLYHGGRILSWFARPYLRTVYRQADRLLAPSPFAKQRLRQIGVETPCVVQSNGVDPADYVPAPAKGRSFRDSYGIGQEETVVGCVGLLSKRKGLDRFIQVAEAMPDHTFVWVGENVYGRLLKDHRYVKRLQRDTPENVVLTGYVEDIRAAYSSMDAFLFPTRIETEGMVALEATCAGLPLVVSDIPGLSWLDDGMHCLKADSIEQFQQHITSVVSGGEHREQMVENAQNLVADRTIDRVAAQLAEHYRDLL